MTMLTRWNPFRSVARFDPNSDFEDMFRGLSLRPFLRELENSVPDLRIDVQEDEKNYCVKIDVPGAKKDDIQVSIDGNQVRVEAEIKSEETHEDRKQVHTERYVGKSYRAFGLPQEVDADKSEAQYDDGVLTLTLPKKNNGQAKRIAIN